jgi:hypothetical protein
MPNPKLRSRNNHWKEINRSEIVDISAFARTSSETGNKGNSSWRKFWDLFSERFHGLLEFLHSVDNKSYEGCP